MSICRSAIFIRVSPCWRCPTCTRPNVYFSGMSSPSRQSNILHNRRRPMWFYETHVKGTMFDRRVCKCWWCVSYPQQKKQLDRLLSPSPSLLVDNWKIVLGSMMAMFWSFVSASAQLRQQQQQQQQPGSGPGSLAAPSESIESQFSCPICLEVYHKPVSIASCAHT